MFMEQSSVKPKLSVKEGALRVGLNLLLYGRILGGSPMFKSFCVSRFSELRFSGCPRRYGISAERYGGW